MLQPRIRAARPTLEHLTNSLAALCLRQPNQTRHASHAAQGRANGPTDSAGRRLGLKKGNSEHVVPGNIIFKQRGTKWHPGENVGVGKDHTLYALAEGYVRYYRNPAAHPTRRFIGVALAKDGKESMLPTPPNAPTRRRVGMVAVPMKAPATQSEADQFLEQHATPGSKPASPSGMQPPTPVKPADAPIMRFRGYRISNVQLARDAEANAVKVRPYVRKDRWYAWRVRVNKAKNRKVFRASGGGGRKKSAGPRGGTKKTKAKR